MKLFSSEKNSLFGPKVLCSNKGIVVWVKNNKIRKYFNLKIVINRKIAVASSNYTNEKFEEFKRIKKRSGISMDIESMRELKNFVDTFRSDITPVEEDMMQLQLKQEIFKSDSLITEIFFSISLFCKELSEILEEYLMAEKTTDSSELAQLMKSRLPPKASVYVANFISVLNSLASLAITFSLTWLLNFFGANAWERWNLPMVPNHWNVVSLWVSWTLPHALATFVFWHPNIRSRYRATTAFTLAETNMRLMDDYLLKDFSMMPTLPLLFKVSTEAFCKVVLQQGLCLGIISAITSGNVGDVDIYESSMGSLALPNAIPRLLHVPFDIGILSILVGVSSIFQDQSFFLDSDIATEIPGRDSREEAATLEEFELLSDTQVSNQRVWLTFFYYFLNGAYLTTETLATNSLLLPFGTLSVGLFIMYKSMQSLKKV